MTMMMMTREKSGDYKKSLAHWQFSGFVPQLSGHEPNVWSFFLCCRVQRHRRLHEPEVLGHSDAESEEEPEKRPVAEESGDEEEEEEELDEEVCTFIWIGRGKNYDSSTPLWIWAICDLQLSRIFILLLSFFAGNWEEAYFVETKSQAAERRGGKNVFHIPPLFAFMFLFAR